MRKLINTNLHSTAALKVHVCLRKIYKLARAHIGDFRNSASDASLSTHQI